MPISTNRLVIMLEGGEVQNILASNEGIEVVIVNFDMKDPKTWSYLCLIATGAKIKEQINQIFDTLHYGKGTLI